MAKKKNRPETSVKMMVYALACPSDPRVYVGQCSAANLRQIYRLHISGKYPATKVFFEERDEVRDLPCAIRLGEFEGSARNKSLLFAWLKYFQQSGAELLISDDYREWLKDITDESAEIYEQIKDRPIEDVFCDDAIVIRDYRPRSWGLPEPHESSGLATVSCKVPREQADEIRRLADKAGLSVSSYIKSMALSGVVIKEDAEVVRDFISMGREIRDEIKKVRESIEYIEGAYPAHLKALEDISGRCADIYNELYSVTVSENRAVKQAARSAVRQALSSRKRREEKQDDNKTDSH